MKIAGRIFTGPRVETVVLPRQDGDIVIKAKAVLDFDEFEKLCKAPEPPMMMKPGGEQLPLLDDKDYLKKLEAYADKKTNWMMLKSLEATEGLEWETVDFNDPDTWGNYQEELKKAGFSFAEVGTIVRLVSDACGLNQSKIEEATKSFLAGQVDQPE